MSYLTAVRHLKYFHFWACAGLSLDWWVLHNLWVFSLAVIERRSVVTRVYRSVTEGLHH